MTPAECTELVDRLKRRGQVDVDAWMRALEPCDPDHAERIIAGLLRSLMRVPSVDEFVQAMRDDSPERWRMSDEERQRGLERVAALRAQLKGGCGKKSYRSPLTRRGN